MTTQKIAPGSLPVDTWARVVKGFAEAVVAGSEALLRSATEPTSNGPVTDAAALEVVVEVLERITRPSRPGEPQRVELYCVQRGPMPPPPPFALWVTLPPGHALPEHGQQFRLTWSPV